MDRIIIKNAGEHNLRSVDLEIPRDSLVVVTGVSGSGKSSLAFDTICREAQRRYLRTLSSYARMYIGKLGMPDFEIMTGLSPSISIDQKTVVRNPRSTVGTISGLSDHLRLLFSRLGDCEPGTSSSLFSFNSEKGACPECKGLGVEDRIVPELLISDDTKTIREGALVLTTPNGYLVYSQVTLDVLDEVCRAHGFNIDIPWKELTAEQVNVVLNGSERIKIPFGKHPLESRLKWNGLTARPREEGYYKGILPVMEDILRRDRNRNILRFARSIKCDRCGGRRLGREALGVTCLGMNIAEMSEMTVDRLHEFFSLIDLSEKDSPVGGPIARQIIERTGLLRDLGLGYLTCDRESTTLSGGEAQRIRLAGLAGGGLQGLLYVLDEPSIGLHPSDNKKMLSILKKLRDRGNTVLVVEHDEETMYSADYLVDIGPKAGVLGGKILYAGPPSDMESADPASETMAYLLGKKKIKAPDVYREGSGEIRIGGARGFNLRDIDVIFRTGAFNVVTGVSGAGKSTLVNRTLSAILKGEAEKGGELCRSLEGIDLIDSVIEIDQAPIGRTPRSNPATYTKLFDLIRDLFAGCRVSRDRGYDKGRFSFNVEGGRCEACQGAGVQQIGMHFLENISVICEECDGKRFDGSTLEVLYRGVNIHDVLEMPVEEAANFFSDDKRIMRHLGALLDVGLGYITLGQPSTTLSGGEAQRVKLASRLARPSSGKTLYILNEPTTSLHTADIAILLRAIRSLVEAGNTVVAIEHNLDFIRSADWMIDLGPGSGEEGGGLVFMGRPGEAVLAEESLTGMALRDAARDTLAMSMDIEREESAGPKKQIELRGVTTHNLRSVDVDIPHGKITVITGVSGSGKSSLAFDTLYAQSRMLYFGSLSTQARRYMKKIPLPPVEQTAGLNAAIAIGQNRSIDNPRSIIATVTEIYDHYRLLFSRAGMVGDRATDFSARIFSFNHHQGACPQCRGLGVKTVCSAEALVSHPHLSLLNGAMDGSRTGGFYGERGGQYLAILVAVGEKKRIDYSVPYDELSSEARQLAMHGAGDEFFSAVWRFNRKGREGEHRWEVRWPGFCGHVEREYERVHADKRGEKMLPLMEDVTCPACSGARLSPEVLRVIFAGKNISSLCAMTVDETLQFLSYIDEDQKNSGLTERQIIVTEALRREIAGRLEPIRQMGLGYLRLDRRTSTLSGGELQRVLLAAQLGSRLCSVTYVLDEPTVGLHERDTEKLIDIMKRLRDEGNTVIVVEHDEKVIRAADHIIDMGPGAGTSGGRVVAEGNIDSIESDPSSLTGMYLSGWKRIGRADRKWQQCDGLEIRGAEANNLKNLDLTIPAGGITAVTGVSGSGKSSLVFDVIASSFERKKPAGCREIVGFERFAGVISIDQGPIGSSSLSNPATYCGIFDRIRELFACEKISKERKYAKARFSFNSKGGRCEHCRGMGTKKVEMGFLADVHVPCEECGGRRYNEETLAIKHRGRNIFETLNMTIDEAKELFIDDRMLSAALDILSSVGLGYLQLGQRSDTLSGGESQRLKLAAELIKSQMKKRSAGGLSESAGKNLYILDEPTTGLHFQDIERLIGIFDGLAADGHTILVVEHNLEVIANADWIIDLGPEGGDEGGGIVACGAMDAIMASASSYTGQALRERGRHKTKQDPYPT
ncbi:MAG: excinuclease ABC subunit UvrA [Candidatus Krumholzibacteriota bacterium]|nr:excinuclease ABC subunit UvrA [Candidatus Krumholzibacteriota bacterium]